MKGKEGELKKAVEFAQLRAELTKKNKTCAVAKIVKEGGGNVRFVEAVIPHNKYKTTESKPTSAWRSSKR